MTNGEHYKTVEARTIAFRKFCTNKICKGKGANCILSNKIQDTFSNKCEFAWLDLEYEELLKCPFCDGSAILYAAGIPYVRCDDCGTQTAAYQTPEAAIKAWNRRVK